MPKHSRSRGASSPKSQADVPPSGIAFKNSFDTSRVADLAHEAQKFNEDSDALRDAVKGIEDALINMSLGLNARVETQSDDPEHGSKRWLSFEKALVESQPRLFVIDEWEEVEGAKHRDRRKSSRTQWLQTSREVKVLTALSLPLLIEELIEKVCEKRKSVACSLTIASSVLQHLHVEDK